MDKATMKALEQDGEKLRQLTGEDHGPYFLEEHIPAQQLVARIKRSSKYYGQTTPGEWFDVRVVGDRSYRLRGNQNNYRIADVALGMRLENGEVVELKD